MQPLRTVRWPAPVRLRVEGLEHFPPTPVVLSEPVPRFFAFLFVCHYIYRGWIFPALIRRPSQNFDLGVAFGSWGVTLMPVAVRSTLVVEYTYSEWISVSV